VAVSRAVTSAFATALRSRRARDLAAVLLAVCAALLGPIQLVVLNGAQGTDWDRVAEVAGVVAWTPLGAPYTLGSDVAVGRWWAVPLKLLIVAASVAALLAWWSRSLETAMLGAAGGQAAAARGGKPAGSPVEQLVPRWLPPGRFGALVGREVRYWWREARRRAGLITFTVIGVVLPVMVNVTGDAGGSLPVTAAWMIFVGVLAAISLANQFGYEGTAYAANIVAGVPGRVELHSRVLGLTVYLAPIMLAIAVVVSLLVGGPGWIAALIGVLFASYGVGLAVVLPVSVFAAYAMPDTSNPFAISSGGGMAKSLFSFAAMVVAGVLTLPYVVAGFVVGDGWLWAALPVGVLYGGVAYLVGAHVTGALLDRRMPELLQAVNPRR
jgi:ABC-2 type transport system permease protein